MLPGFSDLMEMEGTYTPDFQNWCFGPKRHKWSRLLTNMKQLRQLARTCPKNHEHAPWGVAYSNSRWHFATADKCEYQLQLCAEWCAEWADIV